MSNILLRVDTKGLCLFCLKPCHHPLSPQTVSNNLTSVGFEKLLRYLEVNPTRLLNPLQLYSMGLSEHEVNVRKDVDMKVTMCEACSVVIDKFYEAYTQFQLARYQFDKCALQVHTSIKNGDENPDRVREYKERMTPDPLVATELSNASFVSNLRSETFKQCTKKLQCVPRDRMMSHPKVIRRFLTSQNIAVDIYPSAPSTSRPTADMPSTSRPTADMPSTSSANVSEMLSHNRRQPKQDQNVPKKKKEVMEVIDLDSGASSSTPATIGGGDRSKKVCCVNCGSSFSSQAMLTHHMEVDSCYEPRRKRACPFCSYTSTFASALENHMRIMHTVPMVMGHIPERTEAEVGAAVARIIETIPTVDNRCGRCGKELLDFSQLKRHFLATHFEELVEQTRTGFGTAAK